MRWSRHLTYSSIIAEDYKTLRGFPDDQEIMDYSDAKRMVRLTSDQAKSSAVNSINTGIRPLIFYNLWSRLRSSKTDSSTVRFLTFLD